MHSIHDMISKQVTEEVERKMNTEYICEDCVDLRAEVTGLKAEVVYKDAEILRLVTLNEEIINEILSGGTRI